MPPSHKPTEEQRDIAALWLARRTGGSLSEEEHIELEAWLNANPMNRQAWDEMRIMWAQLEEPAARVARQAPPYGAIRRRAASPRGWLTAACGAAMVAVAVWAFNPNIVEDFQADVVSGRQFVTQLTLPDGSTARIAADTALALDFDAARRHVRLLRGEAFFEVVPGSAPAFTVETQGDRVRVVGTRFNVDRLADTTTVVVEEGEVAVEGMQDRDPSSLRPGQKVAVVSGLSGAVEAADLESSLAWMSGRLVVQQATVADVVAVLARHSSSRLVVRGGLSQRRVSGTFALDDVDGSLETIAAAVDGTVVRNLPFVTIVF